MNHAAPHTINYTGHRASKRAPQSRPGRHDSAPAREERLDKEIERISPEGAPAHAQEGVSSVVRIVLFELALFVVLAVAIGLIFSWAAALLVFGLGSVLGIAANPEFWAFFPRQAERRKAASRAE